MDAKDQAPKRWLTVKQAAGELGLAPSAIYLLVARNQLACYRIGPNRGRIRFKAEDLDAYAERCRQGPKIKPPADPPRQRYVPKLDSSKPGSPPFRR